MAAAMLGLGAQAANVEDICKTYNVAEFTGWENLWWHSTSDWKEFSYKDYSVNLKHVEGNNVCLDGFFADGYDAFNGTYDPETSTISFPTQDPYGNSNYLFSKEAWNGNIAIPSDEPVVATIDEDGTVHMNDWTILYVTKSDDGDSYWAYFSGIVLTLNTDFSGVDTIDSDNAPVYYYNLQGMRVDRDNMAPGLYISKQGKKTQKLFVK